MINIIKRPTLLFYREEYPKAATALDIWYNKFKKQTIKTPQELKEKYGSASIIGNKRVVFNIMGNRYRLIVKMNYEAKLCYVIWFGTHELYNAINAETIQFEEHQYIYL